MIESLSSIRRTQRLRLVLIVFAVAALAVLLIWWIGEARTEASLEAEREKPVAVPRRVVSENGRPVVKIDLATQRRNGIETQSVASAYGSAPVRAFASVLDVARLTDLSNNYLSASTQLSAARAKAAASRAARDRARLLYKDAQNVSLAQYQTAEATYQADQAAVSAAQAQLQTTIATARQEFGSTLGLGSSLVAGLMQRQLVLLQVTALPDAAVRAPPATIPVQADRGLIVRARFVSAAARTDPRIQGSSFYYVAPASSGLLPGMNIIALLPGGAGASGAAVPETAVVSWQGRSWIYRRTGPQTFERVAISTDVPAPGGGYLVEGLPAESQVVTRGAQLLLSEEMRSQTQAVGEQD